MIDTKYRLSWIGVAALALAACSPTGNDGSTGSTSSPLNNGRASFVRAPQAARLVSPAKAMGRDRETITAVVKVSGDSITAVQGLTADRRLTRDDKTRLRADLKLRQQGVRASIESLGGRVVRDYQNAYNGFKVRIARGQIERLRALPGVVSVHPSRVVLRDNTHGAALVGAPAVWAGALGARGEGMRIGIIDSGIDYTHADFGGPGTVAAYEAAFAASTAAADPAVFGPAAPKVKGGVDLVGDDYDANDPASVPQPDVNPLDCGAHGTHVAATAAGFGVTAAGARYTGSYDASTLTGNSFRIGPGTAPLADLFAIRVFGCSGSTGDDVIVDAVEWAVDNDMDVINLSLGSPFGTEDGPEQEAIDNAAAAGVVTVASAGNSGPAPYLTGAPGSARRAIAVAAVDATPGYPAAVMSLSTGPSFGTINANGAALPAGALPVVVLKNGDGSVSLGCDPAEYVGVTGALVVTRRGTCARVARAIYGQQAGAAAVAMINTANSLPPFEDQITSNPDTGAPYVVTIPFIGVSGVLGAAPGDDGDNLVAAEGGTATLTKAELPNPTYRALADFTSGGPRNGDSWLKPDVSAPGVAVRSAGMGTGNDAFVFSGTSMAAPHTTGVAALVRQAHPTWSAEDIKLAIVNTADPAGVADYRTSLGGAGLLSAPAAARTGVVAWGDRYTGALNFGFEELARDYSVRKTVHVENLSTRDVTFQVSAGTPQGSPHSVVLSASTVVVKARKSATFDVRLNVPAATVGDTNNFREVAGLVTLAPVSGGNGGVSLRLPYYLVPRALSSVQTRISPALSKNRLSSTAQISNTGAAIAGTADFYSWGLEDDNERLAWNDLRAVGVQTFSDPSDTDPDRRLLVFAVNTWKAWSNASVNEFDIPVDVNDDGVADYVVVGVDEGAITGGGYSGKLVTAVFDLSSGAGALTFYAVAPTDSSTVLLPLYSNDLCFAGSPCLDKAHPRLSYQAASYSWDGSQDDIAGYARFNAWVSAISQGQFATVAAGASTSVPVAANKIEWSLTPPKGLMVVSGDNRNGRDEAQLIRVSLP